MSLLPRVLLRRLGPLGVALTVYDVWRHLPAKQRRRLLALARGQGGRVARYAAAKGSERIRALRG